MYLTPKGNMVFAIKNEHGHSLGQLRFMSSHGNREPNLLFSGMRLYTKLQTNEAH